MQKAWELLEYLFALTAMFLVALFVCYAMPHPQGKPDKDVWDILTAVGTVSAAIVALAISLKQGSRERKAAMTKARICAASLRHRLAIALIELNQIKYWLDSVAEADGTPQQYQAFQDRLMRVDVAIDLDRLAMLSPLNNGCAVKLAEAGSEIELLRHFLRSMGPAFVTGTCEQRRTSAGAMSNMMVGLIQRVTDGTNECQSAALRLSRPYSQ